MPLCVAQEAYTFNDSDKYALKFDGMPSHTYIISAYMFATLFYVNWTDKHYQCEDGHALVTDNNWILSCPPNEEIISRSLLVLNMIPSLSPSTTIGEY